MMRAVLVLPDPLGPVKSKAGGGSKESSRHHLSSMAFRTSVT